MSWANREASVKVIARNNLETVLEVMLSQSLNREIHRVMARVGFKVKSLKRTHIGNIRLKGLGPGAWRPLTNSEVQYLYKATQTEKPLKKLPGREGGRKEAITPQEDQT
jgi:16S rRNA U516 pseudouridylate synthase RsuA-like enzyme